MSDFTDIMLPITCPVCQHTWQMDTPSIPWRVLPVSGKVLCASCDTTLLVLFQEKDGQLHRGIKIEESLPPTTIGESMSAQELARQILDIINEAMERASNSPEMQAYDNMHIALDGIELLCKEHIKE